MIKYQVIAKSSETKDIGGGRKSIKAAEVKVGDPENDKEEANKHATSLQEAMHQLGRTEVTVEVIEVDVA